MGKPVNGKEHGNLITKKGGTGDWGRSGRGGREPGKVPSVGSHTRMSRLPAQKDLAPSLCPGHTERSPQQGLCIADPSAWEAVPTPEHSVAQAFSSKSRPQPPHPRELL